jgi:hypothetical protein
VWWRKAFPEQVVDAILAHPENRIRMALAENGFVSGEMRAWLIDDPNELVRSEALGSYDTSRELLAGLAGHEGADKRRAACRAWDLMDAATPRTEPRQAPSGEVRRSAIDAA